MSYPLPPKMPQLLPDDPVEPEIPENLHALGDEALLAILVGKGHAHRPLEEAGSLQDLARWSLPEIVNRGKVPRKAAEKLHAALIAGKRGFEKAPPRGEMISSSSQVYNALAPLMAHETVEKVYAITLDVKNHIVGRRLISTGTVSASMMHPRDIIRAAIRDNAHAFIIAHNHPSGIAVPSDEDVAITKRLAEAASAAGIRFLDHVIVTPNDFYSFADAGRMR